MIEFNAPITPEEMERKKVNGRLRCLVCGKDPRSSDHWKLGCALEILRPGKKGTRG